MSIHVLPEKHRLALPNVSISVVVKFDVNKHLNPTYCFRNFIYLNKISSFYSYASTLKEKYVFLCADGEYVKQLSGRLLVLKLKYSSKSLLPLIIFLLFEGKLWLCKFYYNILELVTYFSENFRATG